MARVRATPPPRRRRTGLAHALAAPLAYASLLVPQAISPSLSRSTPLVGPVRDEVLVALDHLVGSPKGVAELAPYVQGMDPAMVVALAAGAEAQRANSTGLLSTGTVTSLNDVRATGQVATFEFALADSSERGYTEEFAGTAVPVNGRWELSWVTVCMLVEQDGVVCPDPPAGVVATVPLPYSVTAQEFLADQVPDLLRPDALAMGDKGDLLIEDDARDQNPEPVVFGRAERLRRGRETGLFG